MESLERQHIEAWLDSLEQRGNGPATVCARLAAVRAFYRWAVDVDIRSDSPLSKIRPPRLPVKVEATYTAEDITAVLAAIPTKKAASLLDLRDAALILFLGDTGLRASELCSLDVEDVDTRLQQVTVVGKGQKSRTVCFGAEASAALFQYLRRRGTGGPLFVSQSGERLTVNSLRMALERRFKAAGVAFDGCHAFRRGWACSLLANGSNLIDLMRLAGWNSVSMAERYGRATATERAIAAYRSPMDRIIGKGR